MHTAFDNKGNAYTTLFLDSQIVKWDVEAAIKQFKGDKAVKVVIDRLDVHYQPGHDTASMGEIKKPMASSLTPATSSPKTASCRSACMWKPEQLIDISGDKMKLIHDHTAYPEPHDAIIVRRDRSIKTRQVYNMDEFPNAVTDPKSQKVERNGKKVTVFMASQAPAFSMREFRVKLGDEVTIILTNHDKVNLTHGFGIPLYNRCCR